MTFNHSHDNYGFHDHPVFEFAAEHTEWHKKNKMSISDDTKDYEFGRYRQDTIARNDVREKVATVRIFPEDETTTVEYKNVTHAFWEAGNTVLVLCLPGGKHAHWLREWIRHYDVIDES